MQFQKIAVKPIYYIGQAPDCLAIAKTLADNILYF